MKSYQLAIVKFNNGNGACLCNGCNVILSYGHEHEDVKRFCDSCVRKLQAVIKAQAHQLEKLTGPMDRDPYERLHNGG